MTIASEITRLQNDKEAMRQSIINKGVNVDASVNFDSYAACIDAIEADDPTDGIKVYMADILMVGGGGSGAGLCASVRLGAGGGGGGEVLIRNGEFIQKNIGVVVGCGAVYCTLSGNVSGRPGQPSKILSGSGIVANGGCGGAYDSTLGRGGMSGSGCLGYYNSNANVAGGGGGGAGCCATNLNGGAGICGYGGGGGGGNGCNQTTAGTGCDGGGNGGAYVSGCNATNCGGGGGGAGYGAGNRGGCGGNGLVKICYKTNGTCGIKCAIGGTVTTSGDYKVHTFTDNGTLFINPKATSKLISYLAVGGGGGGYYSGGGGGEVLLGGYDVKSSLCVKIGAGGSGCLGKGGDTCIGSDIVAHGGCGSNGVQGGTSGSGYEGSCCCNGGRATYGGGGGAGGPGEGACLMNRCTGGNGGWGIAGYGYGGGGCGYSGCGYGCNTCGSGGTNMCAGCPGIVKICYPSDGSWGINDATGGTKTLENGYCVHTFTANGTFEIVS